jgi:hypothetical protein
MSPRCASQPAIEAIEIPGQLGGDSGADEVREIAAAKAAAQAALAEQGASADGADEDEDYDAEQEPLAQRG